MKRLEVQSDRQVFQMSWVEKKLLTELLGFYPVIPAQYAKLNRSSDSPPLIEAQQLLDEALAEQRAQNRQRVADFLHDPRRFLPDRDGFRLILTAAELEWLLQVLNDIRVGSWFSLGSPENIHPNAISRTPKNEPYLRAMDGCGYFQAVLLGNVS